MAGNSSAGTGLPCSGKVRNLDVRQGALGTADIAYLHEVLNAELYSVGAYLDGEMAVKNPPDAREASVSALVEGVHTIEMFPNLSDDAWPPRHGAPDGQRAYVTWDRSTDSTTRGYNLYWDEGDGGAADVLLATITEMEVEVLQYAKPNVGSGIGRLSAFGSFNHTDPINETLVIEITDNVLGEFSWTVGALSGTGEFGVVAETVTMPYGVAITFHDEASFYENGDEFHIAIGPANHFLTDELDPDTYQFTATALDAIDPDDANESDPLTERSVVIPEVPDVITGYAADWMPNPPDEEWHIVIDADENRDGVRMYTNYDRNAQVFRDYVMEDNAADEVITADPQEFVFSPEPGVEGTLLFYLRPYTGDIERKEVILYRLNFPATPAEKGILLGTPTNVTATPIADGKVRIEFDYQFQEGDDITVFQVAIQGGEPLDEFSSQGRTVNITAGTGVLGYLLQHFSYTSPDSFAAGTWYAGVRAVYEEDVTYNDSEVVSFEPDDTPPDFEGNIYGISQ